MSDRNPTNFLTSLYGTGLDYDYLTYWPDDFNLGFMIRIRPQPTDKHLVPFIEVSETNKGFFGDVWTTPEREVSVISIDNKEVIFTKTGFTLPEKLDRWLTLNKGALLKFWTDDNQDEIDDLLVSID